jgi:hypothetical protein
MKHNRRKAKGRGNRKSKSAKHLDEPLLLSDIPRDLHGLSSNRWGGNQLQRLEGLTGGTYGPASKVRRFSKEEREALEAEMREKGLLN